jgi:SPP1 family predicted phage head-tail adaptor
MNAGILREKIEIYEPVVTRTQYGNSKTSWNLFYTTRASVQYNSGFEKEENKEIVRTTIYTFIVRHYVPVKETMRIKHDGKMYKIESIKPNKYYNDKEIVAELVNK